MIKRLLVVAIAAVTLAGCANESMSGDVYSASQAKQVQTVTYGTLVSVRPVRSRVVKRRIPLAQSVVPYWVASSVTPSVAVPVAAWQPQPAQSPVA